MLAPGTKHPRQNGNTKEVGLQSANIYISLCLLEATKPNRCYDKLVGIDTEWLSAACWCLGQSTARATRKKIVCNLHINSYVCLKLLSQADAIRSWLASTLKGCQPCAGAWGKAPRAKRQHARSWSAICKFILMLA